VSRVPHPRHFLRYRRRCPAAATTPAQHQPPPPARITGFARSPQVRTLPAAAAHSTCPGDPAPGTPCAAVAAVAPVASAAAALASPIPRRPRECRRHRHSRYVPRVFPPPARPPPPLPRLLQSDDRAGIGHRHLPRHQVRALLTKLSAEPSLLLAGDLAPFF
jgi:hypothetical protein